MQRMPSGHSLPSAQLRAQIGAPLVSTSVLHIGVAVPVAGAAQQSQSSKQLDKKHTPKVGFVGSSETHEAAVSSQISGQSLLTQSP
jgi:hypothetical protein